MAKRRVQTVTASGEWRDRMRAARQRLPEGVGQQDVLEFITTLNSDINRLTYSNRWRNAWSSQCADPEFTQLVEQAADHFQKQKLATRRRLSRQKLTAAQ